MLLEEGQADRQRGLLHVGGQVHQRMQQVVPGILEDEDRQRRHGRLRERQIDAPENVEERGAVHAGGIHQVTRDGEEILSQQEGAEGSAPEGGQDQRPLRPDQMHVLEDDEVRDERNLWRNHHRRQQQREQQVASLELDHGEHKGRHRTGQDLTDDGQDRDLETVEHQREKSIIGQDPKQVHIVLEHDRIRDEVARILLGGFAERDRDHPHEREQHGQRANAQHEISQRIENGLLQRLGHGSTLFVDHITAFPPEHHAHEGSHQQRQLNGLRTGIAHAEEVEGVAVDREDRHRHRTVTAAATGEHVNVVVGLKGIDGGDQGLEENAGRHQRDGHTQELLEAARAVEFGCLVIIARNGGQPCEEDDHALADRAPHVDDHHRQHGVVRAQPADGRKKKAYVYNEETCCIIGKK